MTSQGTNSQQNGSIPQPNSFLLFLAVLFIPGVYILLLACAAGAVALAVWAVHLIIAIADSGLHGVGRRLIIPVALLVLGALMCAYGVLKGLVATVWRKARFEPALHIELGRHRELGHLIASLCSAMGTRIPDAVILHCEPTFYVTQSKIQTLNATVKGRILAIGLPMLGGLTKNELRAVLAHEFAHFTGKDTIYSSLAMPVYAGAITARESMGAAIEGSESYMQMIPLAIPRFVLGLYLGLFHWIDMKLSRQRELRADAIAAITCGTQSFKMSLMKSCGIGCTFHDNEALEIVKKADETNPSTNYHTAFRRALPQLVGIANQHYQDSFAEPENPYDSHPSLKRRLDAVPNIPERYQDTASAASLLTDIEQQEETLSGIYTALTQVASRAGYH